MCVWLLLLQKGNEFGDVFDELQYVQTQIMIIKLRVEEPKIVFDPPFREIRDIILRCFSEIIASGEGLTRVGIYGFIFNETNTFRYAHWSLILK